MTILLLTCMRCGYGAADLAGTLRLQYDPAVRIVRYPCTGRVDITHILKGLVEGADGVMVVGCMKGDCGYKVGNLTCERRVKFVRDILGKLGLGEDRVNMYFLSAADAAKFVDAVEDMTSRVKRLGPNPVKTF
ncbi:MAG: hydrogenase iron-sulfur subunit [Candidatus Bathyarchaeia archaeon]